MAEAGPSEIAVTSTVRDQVIGSGIGFSNRGTYALGIESQWQIYSVQTGV